MLMLRAGSGAAVVSFNAPPSTYVVIGLSKETPDKDLEKLTELFGPAHPGPGRHYAISMESLDAFTRSPTFLAAEINRQFDFAERKNTPIFFHIDPEHGFGADTETSPADAPPVKYWKDPDMCEWAGFPEPGQAPRVPRLWFNWGAWVCMPAIPCFSSPKFLDLAAKQMAAGIAGPIAARVRKLDASGKGYLFAGINIGWETGIPSYHFDPAKLPVSTYSSHRIAMEPWEAQLRAGYAALHWQGWNQARLDAEAQARGITSNALFEELCDQTIHDYNQFLAKSCFDQGISRDRIFTHIVAIPSVKPERTSTGWPPIWTAVNSYSTPGFTMDNRGAAIYDLANLRREIAAADPNQAHFAAIEAYVRHYHDEAGFDAFLHEVFDHGGITMCLYGTFPAGHAFSLDQKRENATLAIYKWLHDN